MTTADASGSTSQAANIVEALEMGSKLLIFDEDTCATNFMFRDARMASLVAPDKEPITPFLERVRRLYDEHGVSCILVVGSCGAFFDVADTVLMMDCYSPRDVTESARGISSKFKANESIEHNLPNPNKSDATSTSASLSLTKLQNSSRKIEVGSLQPGGKVSVKNLSHIMYGSEELAVNLSAVEQLVALGQTRAIADAMQQVADSDNSNSRPTGIFTRPIKQICEDLDTKLDAIGLDAVAPVDRPACGFYSRPRPVELAAAINRWRNLKVAL